LFKFFSFFRRKKEESSAAEPAMTISKEIMDMQSLPANEELARKPMVNLTEKREFRVNSPIGVDPKAMARAAAARIDAIEQEIALDLRGAAAAKIGIHPRANEVALRAGFNRIAPPKGMEVPVASTVFRHSQIPERARLEVMPEVAHTLILGDTDLSAIIEVKESNIAPALEEAAVLFANGRTEEAIESLITAFKDKKSLGNSEFNAYRMLFDLLRYKGDSDLFDRYAIDFATRFEKSPPSWQLTKTLPTKVHDSIPTLDLGEMLDSSIVPVLEQLKVVAQKNNRMRLDAGNISHINYTDGFGCELLMRVLNAFESTKYELELIGTQHLFTKLRPYIQAKKSNVSGHLWLLYLEMLRLQNQQMLFEDLSFKFASVYEVSPPSWKPPSKQLQDTSKGKVDPATMITFDQPDFIFLSGEIKSNSDSLINQLAKGLHASATVICDCKDLRLISFEATGRLLTALTAWSAELKTVEFKNLSNPIATLFVVLGLHHLAVVERRRDA
jgi:ABC-type transporter Mla MlaB component